MKYLNRLIHHESYRAVYQQLVELEEDRMYCKHDMNHFLDVARLAANINMEKNLQVDLEMIYLCAFLHDIGRGINDKKQISHSQASANLAREILLHIDYPTQQMETILYAITRHGTRGNVDLLLQNEYMAGFFTAGDDVPGKLTFLLQTADQLSRSCYLCPVEASCKWKEQEKIKKIVR